MSETSEAVFLELVAGRRHEIRPEALKSIFKTQGGVMRNPRVFTTSVTVTIGLVVLAAMMWSSHQQIALSAAPEPAQGTPASGGAVTANLTTTTVSGAFVDMPNMSITTTFIRTGDLLIGFSGESSASNAATSLRIRCLMDGNVVAPSEVVFDSGPGTECHAMNFLAPNVSPGIHQIRVQWRQTGGGTVIIDERTLSYTNVN